VSGEYVQHNVWLRRDVAERIRNAVDALRYPLGLTVVTVTEQALADAATRLEAEHNGGVPFPPPPIRTTHPGRIGARQAAMESGW
jgi:hypothetical protein